MLLAPTAPAERSRTDHLVGHVDVPGARGQRRLRDRLEAEDLVAAGPAQRGQLAGRR